jgi:L-lysine exporter family protein LysE/ArgO
MTGSVFLAGFLLGLSLIVAIGARNAFVLRQGLLGAHVLPVCLVCSISDAASICLGVFGLAFITDAVPLIVPVLRYAGAAFLVLYGLRAARAALAGGGRLTAQGEAGSLGRTLAICLALTWLNPHVYLDTVLLVGSIATQYARPDVFAAGAVTASFLFFFGLGFGARLLRPIFAQAAA